MRNRRPDPRQSKAIGDSFPVGLNSRTRLAGQLRERSGPCLDHVFLLLKVRRPPRLHCTERLLGDQRGVMSKDVLCPYVFWVKSILAKEMHTHMWEDPEVCQVWTVKQENQNDWPKEIRKKCPIKAVQTTRRMPLWDLLSLPESTHVYPCVVPFSLLINTLFASLLSLFAGILSCKAEGPGPLSLTTGLVARIWGARTKPSLWLGTQAKLQIIAG